MIENGNLIFGQTFASILGLYEHCPREMVRFGECDIMEEELVNQ